MRRKIIISEEQARSLMGYYPFEEDWFKALPDKFRIYHGSRDEWMMEEIVTSMTLDASAGGQHGETSGVNWFSLKNAGYDIGGVISIEVSKEDFANRKFKFMNRGDITSYEPKLDLRPYSMRVEKFLGIPRKRFLDAFVKAGKDIWDFQDIIIQWNNDEYPTGSGVDFQLVNPVVRYIIEEAFGKSAMKEFYEWKNELNESKKKDKKKVNSGLMPYEFGLGSDQPGGGDLGNYHVSPSVMEEGLDEVFDEVKGEYAVEGDSVIDLSSFRPHRELHPKLWPNRYLNSKVRLRLLDIADDFIEFLNLPWAKPCDIILTGSLCSFNYSKFSDFDLHILYDFTDIDDRVEFVKQYVDAKKSQWNDMHENLKIYGFPVEVYVQDVNEEHTANGMYSLESNDWIKIPEVDNIKAIRLEKFTIKNKILKYIREINKLITAADATDDKKQLEDLGEKVKKLFDRIKGMRREGLKKRGEMSIGNIVFKYLRRYDYISDLMDLKYELYDKIKSLEKV